MNGRGKTPSLLAIHRYWCTQESEPFDLAPEEADEPFCYACGWQSLRACPRYDTVNGVWIIAVPEPTSRERRRRPSGGLERAHLVDFALGGGNGVGDMVPLCGQCHHRMPSFGSGERDAAIEWVNIQPHWTVESWPRVAAACRWMVENRRLPSWMRTYLPLDERIETLRMLTDVIIHRDAHPREPVPWEIGAREVTP